MQVDFDPEQTSFEEIVNLFWKSHNPIGMRRGSQYKSAIWFADDDQLAVIESSVKSLEVKYDRELTTEVLPLGKFFNAEDYHQKYILQRHDRLMKSFKAMYPRFSDFVDSTAAARLNGFAAGQGSREMFEKEKTGYGNDVTEVEKVFTR